MFIITRKKIVTMAIFERCTIMYVLYGPEQKENVHHIEARANINRNNSKQIYIECRDKPQVSQDNSCIKEGFTDLHMLYFNKLDIR